MIYKNTSRHSPVLYWNVTGTDHGILGILGTRYIWGIKSHSMLKPNYKKGYEILEEYFDCIPEDLRTIVSKRLDKVGL